MLVPLLIERPGIVNPRTLRLVLRPVLRPVLRFGLRPILWPVLRLGLRPIGLNSSFRRAARHPFRLARRRGIGLTGGRGIAGRLAGAGHRSPRIIGRLGPHIGASATLRPSTGTTSARISRPTGHTCGLCSPGGPGGPGGSRRSGCTGWPCRIGGRAGLSRRPGTGGCTRVGWRAGTGLVRRRSDQDRSIGAAQLAGRHPVENLPDNGLAVTPRRVALTHAVKSSTPTGSNQ